VGDDDGATGNAIFFARYGDLDPASTDSKSGPSIRSESREP